MTKRYQTWLLAGVGCFMAGSIVLAAGLTDPVDSYQECLQAGYPVTDSNPPVCRIGNHNFTGPTATPTATPPPATSLTFYLLVSSDAAGQYPERREAIQSQADWQRYWREVHASLATLPPILPVDFSTHDVLAASTGPEATGGYNLRITSVTAGAAGTVVNVTETVPTITCIVPQSFSNRYTAVLTDKLPEPIIFRLTTDYRQC
ncbi:MAG TPA: hypothetical protein VLF67_05420 [Candidatus Saccharimonas sp.]|nr:hypothetical protein [Candidatus Saccharimonas sp.]